MCASCVCACEQYVHAYANIYVTMYRCIHIFTRIQICLFCLAIQKPSKWLYKYVRAIVDHCINNYSYLCQKQYICISAAISKPWHSINYSELLVHINHHVKFEYHRQSATHDIYPSSALVLRLVAWKPPCHPATMLRYPLGCCLRHLAARAFKQGAAMVASSEDHW